MNNKISKQLADNAKMEKESLDKGNDELHKLMKE